MISTRKAACVLSAVVMLALALSACRHTSDEAQVREAIATIAKAAGAGEAGHVMAPLSDDFDGNAGELDRRALGNMVRLISLRDEHIGVAMGPLSVEHRGERLVATFTVTLSSGGNLLPDQLGLYQVESAWRRENGQWRCYSATWKHSL